MFSIFIKWKNWINLIEWFSVEIYFEFQIAPSNYPLVSVMVYIKTFCKNRLPCMEVTYLCGQQFIAVFNTIDVKNLANFWNGGNFLFLIRNCLQSTASLLLRFDHFLNLMMLLTRPSQRATFWLDNQLFSAQSWLKGLSFRLIYSNRCFTSV